MGRETEIWIVESTDTYVVEARRESGVDDGHGRSSGLGLRLRRGAGEEIGHRLEVGLGEGHVLSEGLSDSVLHGDSLRPESVRYLSRKRSCRRTSSMMLVLT